MSVQFGRWNFECRQPIQDYLKKVETLLARYGPDTDESYSDSGATILYRAFHTTKESRRETQPHISRSGAVITWDGRLDNRPEVLNDLRTLSTINSTDVQIVSAAYEKWGANCLGKLIGDWALSIYSPSDRSLILAKDVVGPRHLYYSLDDKQVTWSSILDPLVLLADRRFELCEEYIAGWLSTFPAAHLTPYVGVLAVPPSSYVLVTPGKHIVTTYWDFDSSKRISYRTDAEYEEHFRSVFASAIQCRLRCDTPVLAELSGGKDSSAIVCLADEIIARGDAETPRLDTISYYDDSEPNWNERPYFTKIEEKRGRVGWHINVGLQHLGKTSFFETCQFPDHRLVPAPRLSARISEQIRTCLASQGNRVLLSGIGGDEVMGGAPIPVPELQDLFASARFVMLAHQLKVWALQQRRPWFHLFLEVAFGFCPPRLVGVPKHMRPAPWLQSNFVNRHRIALTGYPRRVKLFGSLPSFQDNVGTFDGLRRQMASKPLRFQELYEKRYPYLDRNLLEFMYAVPREQSVRPAQRRSLLRRALAGFVPTEVLDRKRKAIVARAPLLRLSDEDTNLAGMTQRMISSSLGIVNLQFFFCELQKAQHREGNNSLRLRRAIEIEAWLRNLVSIGIIGIQDADKYSMSSNTLAAK